jgi:hypothetical protein
MLHRILDPANLVNDKRKSIRRARMCTETDGLLLHIYFTSNEKLDREELIV